MAHMDHYKKYNKIEMDIYRNGKLIVSDDIYDLMVDTLKKRDSSYTSKINDNNNINKKTKLPLFTFEKLVI